MRTRWTLLTLFVSVATATEPAARIDQVRRGSAVATSASVSASPSRTSGSDDAAGDPEGAVASPSEAVGLAHGQPVIRPHTDATLALEHLQGERSRLEAEKQLLTLQVDIATLHRKLAELESTPRSIPGGPGPAALPVEPPPTVLSRRGFDGHFTAVLKMSSGGRLVVHAGDSLPNGKVEAVDSRGVMVTWYGHRQRLLDAEVEEGNAPAARNLDLTLPVAPAAVTAR